MNFKLHHKKNGHSHDNRKHVTIQMTDGVLIPNKNNGKLMTSWRITFYLALLSLLSLIIFSPEPYREIFLICIKGVPVTFQCTIFAIIGAVIIGTITGLGSV